MKAILISIRPEWVAKILNREKTIEIRTTRPRCELPIDVYIYCTKGKIGAQFVHKMKRCFFGKFVEPMLNGKVVAKFTLREMEKIKHPFINGSYHTKTLSENKLLEKSCLSIRELDDYLDCCYGYAWHISDLVIFDEPKELSEFGLKKAPQSWCYVEVRE